MCAVDHAQLSFHMHLFSVSGPTLAGLRGSQRLVYLWTCLCFKTMGRLIRGGPPMASVRRGKLGRGGRRLGIRSSDEPHFAVACSHREDLTWPCLLRESPTRVRHRRVRWWVATVFTTTAQDDHTDMCFAMRAVLWESRNHTTTVAQDMTSTVLSRAIAWSGRGEETCDTCAWCGPYYPTVHSHRHGLCFACPSHAVSIGESASPPQDAMPRTFSVPGAHPRFRVPSC